MVAVVLAAGAVVAFAVPVLSLLLGCLAIGASLSSRRALRRSGHLRGARLGVLAFLVGVGVSAVIVVPQLISVALVALVPR